MARRTSNIKILYLDIETAPTLAYTWSLFPKFININDITEPGYTLCWAAKWEGDREVKFGSVKDDDMLVTIHELLDEADAVVHYNGTRFDMPTLNREFVLNNMAPPSHYHQIDLLKTVRKQFRFQSNKLDFVAQQLGLGAKTQHKGMALWHGVMAGDKKDWKMMERYNRQDVALTQKLYKALLPWIHNHPNVGMWVEDPKNPVCTNCGSQNVHKHGTQYNTKSASYTRYKCNKCETPLRARLQTKKTSPNVLVRTS